MNGPPELPGAHLGVQLIDVARHQGPAVDVPPDRVVVLAPHRPRLGIEGAASRKAEHRTLLPPGDVRPDQVERPAGKIRGPQYGDVHPWIEQHDPGGVSPSPGVCNRGPVDPGHDVGVGDHQVVTGDKTRAGGQTPPAPGRFDLHDARPDRLDRRPHLRAGLNGHPRLRAGLELGENRREAARQEGALDAGKNRGRRRQTVGEPAHDLGLLKGGGDLAEPDLGKHAADQPHPDQGGEEGYAQAPERVGQLERRELEHSPGGLRPYITADCPEDGGGAEQRERYRNDLARRIFDELRDKRAQTGPDNQAKPEAGVGKELDGCALHRTVDCCAYQQGQDHEIHPVDLAQERDVQGQFRVSTNRSFNKDMVSKHFPAPVTTHSRGRSVRCTGTSHSSAIRIPSPRSMPPPPVSAIPRARIS